MQRPLLRRFVLVFTLRREDSERVSHGLHGVTVTRYSLHALGVALSLTVSTCGLNSLTGSTFEQAPRQREDKRGPACRSESQRARIVHRARPLIDACVMLFDHKTRPAR